MTNTDKIKTKPYRNWVRGALGLFYLQKGLYSFTDRVVKAEHAKIIQHLTPCTGCAIENILPVHAASGKGCIQKNKGKCNCRKRTNRNCPTCSQIYDDIVHQHRFKEPHWVTDCSTWYSDHWQFAKCFLTTTIKGSNNTAADTDVSGLLSIIINGEFFQSELHCSIDPYTGTDIFSQVREIRNEILHNSEQDLMDQDLTRYLQSMIAVLEDKKVLSTDPVAQAAAKKLKELLKDELVITISEEANVIQTALEAIKAAKEQSEESIRKLAKEKRNTIKASEESIRELAEETRSFLRKQTSDLTSEIDAVKERVMEKVTSAVSAAKPDLNELKHGLADHENRLRAVEAEQKDLQRKQLELEQHVAKLKIAEEKHHTRIEYLKQKQDLQQHLVDEYQKEDVKTSISPLMTQQNNVNISDVYASPRMVVEEKENDKDGSRTEAGKDRATNNKHIEIGDLFGTVEKRNRKIFIVGDVGTGKSSLCKMMMQHWCSSMTKRRSSDNSGVMDEMGMTQEKDNDTYVMNQFDFLFYVPLREIPEGTDDIVDMIKGRLRKYKTLVDDIFTNDSERVLILADGLDELTLSKPRGPQWVPKSSLAGGSTILTTSRPSSRGILNMKSSDCDLKVTLLGLKDNKSVQNMIEKYMKLLNKTSDVVVFNMILSYLPFKDIHNAPMLLQQIIWLHCNGHKIGQSRSSVYIHIVNAVLGWYYERKKANPELESTSFEKFSLPKPFDKFRNCQENNKLLLLLGKIAHDAYITGNNSSLAFGRLKLKQLGISGTDIDTIVQTGILTEVNCADPTYEKSQLSFIHTSYVEFFAALYICSSYLSDSSDSSSSNPFTILERLIAVNPETSVTEILRLENVLIMICGLAPGLTEHVCECIYKLTPSGENTDENKHREVKCQIQDLTSYCLSEHISVDQETPVECKLRHLYLVSYPRRLSVLVPTSVETCSLDMFCHSLSHEECLSLISFLSQTVSLRTLKIHRIECSKDECEGHTIDLTNHKELQSVGLSRSKIFLSGINHTCLKSCNIYECELSHEQCSLLSSCLSQTVSLRTLMISDIKCSKDECEGHTIYLTNHKELQSVNLFSSTISVSGINHTCLQSCNIYECELSHEQCSLLSSCLSQAVSLQTLSIHRIECSKDECEGHTIDLTNHKELQSVDLFISIFSISGINLTCLKSCEIYKCKLSHEQCSLLSLCLSQAVSLRTLEISDIKCPKDECEGHTIHLTNHKELQSVKLSDNTISVSGINTSLQSCEISFDMFSFSKLSHEQCSLLSSFLSQAVSLRTLEISDIRCSKYNCEGHTIHLTNHKELQSVKLSDSTISVSGINTSLQSCEISSDMFSFRKLSHEQCSLLSSFLSQAVSLKTLKIKYIKCGQIKCIGDVGEGHYIDLTNHKQLWKLSISHCNEITITGINPTCETRCYIRHCYLSHEQCASLCTFLSKSINLCSIELYGVKCTLENCEGHSIDLTILKQLRELSIPHCNKITITGINPTCSAVCHISFCSLSHEQCASLCTFLSKSINLCSIELYAVECTLENCKGHSIDLTIHKQLRELSISHCNKITITGIDHTNHKQLHTLWISD